jgi:hypothetical protein
LDPVPKQNRNDVQLHLVHQVLSQALAGNIGTSSDGGVAIACRLSGYLRCRRHRPMMIAPVVLTSSTVGRLTSDGLTYQS